jgi:FixJ family two-component response regulator
MYVSILDDNAEARAPLVGVIDDEDAVRDGLHCLLRAHGYRVAAFDSVEAFDSSGDKHGMGCVVSGVRLPGRSGLSLQRWMAQCKPEVPVVFWTAYADEIRVRALAEGAFAVMSKPYTDGLLRVIERALTASHPSPARAVPSGMNPTLGVPSYE